MPTSKFLHISAWYFFEFCLWTTSFIIFIMFLLLVWFICKLTPAIILLMQYLYTLCVEDAEKAEKLTQSLPPGPSFCRCLIPLSYYDTPSFIPCI